MWKKLIIIVVCISFIVMGLFLFNRNKTIDALEKNLTSTQITLEKSKNINQYQLDEFNRVKGDLDKAKAANLVALSKEKELKNELDKSRDYTVSLESEIVWLKDTSETSLATSAIVMEEIGKTRSIVLHIININNEFMVIDDLRPSIVRYAKHQNKLLNNALESLDAGGKSALGLDDSLRSIFLKVEEIEQINKDLQESLDLAEKIQAELRAQLDTAKASEATALTRVTSLEDKTKEQKELIKEAQKLTSNSQLRVKELRFENNIFKLGSGVAVVALILLGGYTLIS